MAKIVIAGFICSALVFLMMGLLAVIQVAGSRDPTAGSALPLYFVFVILPASIVSGVIAMTVGAIWKGFFK